MNELVARQATSGDLASVLSILDEAAGWLRSRSIEQWPDRFETDWVARSVAAGETWLFDGDRATVTLDFTDELWAGEPGPAAYVHRLAVRRSASGLGGRVLDWCEAQARQAGCASLRLDCVATNAELRDYYERRGFTFAGLASVAGAPGQRLACGMTTTVSKYQKPLA